MRSSTDARRLASVRSGGEGPTSRTASAAALVAGTTVGGDSGLPAVVKPAGFVPTVITLTASWLFLLAEALVVASLSRCRGPAAFHGRGTAGAAARRPGLFFALVTATASH